MTKTARGKTWVKKLQKSSPYEVKRINLEIPGFDDLFELGIPAGRNILVAGGPGTGKTLFCLQTLHTAALKGNKCLYITFEESPSNLIGHMWSFGWRIDKVVGNDICTVKVGDGAVLIVRADALRIARSVEAALAKSMGSIRIKVDTRSTLIPEGLSPYMVAIDSLSALESAFTGKPESYRIYIEQLFRLLENLGSTNFLITETEEVPKRFSRSGVEEFLADGVFIFYYLVSQNVRIRAMEVLKMRGTKHKNRIVPFEITSKGIRVYPNEQLYLYKERF